MRRLILLMALAIATDESCRVLCIRQGHDGGSAFKRGCVCATYFLNYDDFVHDRTDMKDLYQINKRDQEPERWYSYRPDK